MTDQEIAEKEVQVLRFKCCNGIYSICIVPDCYIYRPWLNQVKRAVQDGDKIEVLKYKDADLTYHLKDCKNNINKN